MSSIDLSNENSTRIPGVSSWTHFNIDSDLERRLGKRVVEAAPDLAR